MGPPFIFGPIMPGPIMPPLAPECHGAHVGDADSDDRSRQAGGLQGSGAAGQGPTGLA